MTLNELIEALTDFRDDHEADGLGDKEVKVAQQPSWPLAADVEAVTLIGGQLWIGTREDGKYAPERAWEGGEFDSDDEEEYEA